MAKRKGGSPTRSRQGNTKKRDGTTVILAIVAVVLLVLVVLFLDQRLVSGLFPSRRGAVGDSTNAPEILRIDPANETTPVIETPTENPPEGQPSVEEAPVVTGPDPAAVEGEEKTRIFLVKVNDQGQITLKGVLRTVPATTSPLTQSIRSLVEGPKSDELSKGYLSLVPEETALVGARVEAGVAWLDFNEAFRFNALGIEGYRAQVEQVVYTATEYPTVDKVQILVEGQRIDYLGGEGFWVGAPLGRDDF